MIVRRRVARSLLGRRNRIAEQDGEDFVVAQVVLRFVECDEHERVFHEVGVAEERRQERAEKGSGGGDGGVVAVVCHVGRDEHPLRQLVARQIAVKHCEVFYLGQAVGVGGYGVVAHERAACSQLLTPTLSTVCALRVRSRSMCVLVLSDIVIRAGLLVDVVALEATVRHILLVQTPADFLRLEHINNGLRGRANAGETVTGYAMGATADGCDVVWLGWVRNGQVVRERDSLTGDPCEVRCQPSVVASNAEVDKSLRSPAALE